MTEKPSPMQFESYNSESMKIITLWIKNQNSKFTQNEIKIILYSLILKKTDQIKMSIKNKYQKQIHWNWWKYKWNIKRKKSK